MRRIDGQRDPYVFWGITLGVVMFLLYVYPGFLSPVTPRFEGTCRAIELGAAAEDLQIDAATGVAYLSYFDHYLGYRSKEAVKRTGQQPGTIMLLDLNAAEPRPRAALTTEPAGFQPLGLSLYAPANGPKRLFVVNRSTLGRHSIEIFEQSSTGAFAPVETIRDPALWSPNGIVAVGPRQFYVTNDSGFRDRDAADNDRRTESRLRNSRANVLYFDGASMRTTAQRLDMANGIAVSPDGLTVYVSESTGRQVTVFDRDVTTGALKKRGEVGLDTAPDNLTVDADGSVWIAGHPRVTQLWRKLRDPQVRSASQVLKLAPTAGRDKGVEEIYVNDGRELSASTVAASFRNLLVIGSVTDHRVLVCRRGGESTPPITGPEKET